MPMAIVGLGWTRDETVFAILALTIVAMSIFRLDQILFRPRKRTADLRNLPPSRKPRISWEIESEEDSNQGPRG